ncbi:DNRLRE domain-containing protein [Streptomyces sp. RKAG293]|uniref:DNRLRE domain-containing protein n=1 Tax=Streptomyces sp. RKAG293 TaxID=2893403 RepID=UPI002033DCBA|nr:DNRLRE domain-containing protein [Streptomyces sp. RKAG293]MCM2419075.1 DNRLRE domain-containing protein [Streptomyces sp. RKAG293]
MAVTLLDGTSAAIAAPQKTAPQQTAGHYATTAADIPSARVAARLSGKQVEALSERSETSTTWVNANGSLTTEVSAGPIRFKDNGQWRPVDLDLVQNGDGSVAPKAHPRGLKLAGGGGTTARSLTDAGTAPARDLVTLGAGDQQIALQWKGGLPKPTLSGTRATYVNAVPGANLVVEATRTGFEQFVDIAQRPAAGGFAYTLPLKTKGLSVKQLADGSLQFTDAKNNKRAVMPAPTMWDAQIDPVSGEHTHQAPVALKVVADKGSVDLVFTPDTKFLADPKTKFPVTVDPSTATLGNVFDTYAQQGVTVDESTDTELDLGNPGTTNTDGTPRTARSFITWNTAPFADALVTSAKLSLWDFHAGNNVDCAAYPWEVWDTDKASTSTRWPAQPVWHTKSATSTETRGNPSCTAAPDGWINADVTTLAQTWASLKNATSGMGLRASSETVVAQWKRVNSANAASNPPKLVVTYNYRPRNGTDPQAGPPFFKDAAGTWYTNTVTPVLRDTFADPNNDKVNATFQVYDNATGTQVGSNVTSPFVPAGQPASVTVPAGLLVNGKSYKFRSTSYDGTHYSVGWGGWTNFTVDTSAPSAPASVTSTDYPSAAWVKGAGQVGKFTATPPAGDQSGIEWSLDGTTWTKVTTSGTTTPVNFNVTPAKAGTNTLQVRTTDKAENKSEPIAYTFHVGPGGVTLPDDGTRTAARVPLTAEADSSKYNAVTFSWRRGDADAWAPIPAGDVTNAGTALTSWPVALTAGKSPNLAWNATSTVNPDGAVQLKADFTGAGGVSATSDSIDLVVDRTADGATTTSVGPGAINLLTGDYTLAATDATFFGMTVARSASSRSPQAGGATDGQSPIFGKEWLSGTTAEVTASNYTSIRKTSATSLDVLTSAGSTIKFTANAANTGWVPETGAGNLTLKGAFTSGDFTLSDTQGTVTVFSKVAPAATAWTVTSSLSNGLATSTTQVVSEAVTVGGQTLARPKQVIASSTATTLAACAADPSTRGCRILQFIYASATTASGSTFGDVKDQVSAVKLWATAPGATLSTATTVAQYAYDSSGRLRETWDPRVSPALKTSYSYDTNGRVTTLTPPGQLPWTFVYGQAGSSPTAGAGMLLSASRPTLTPGSATQTNGTATTTLVYGVPLTGASAPNDLGSAATASWGQSDLPTDATAIFPSDQVPSSSDGTTLGAGDYARAGIHYLDASGRGVDDATPGHHIAVTEYDRYANAVRSLTAANRELALGTTPAQITQLTNLGINALSTGERAQLLSTTSVFDGTGVRETDTYGPLHQITLSANLISGTTTVASAGTQVTGRQHTVTEYDSGRPTDGTANGANEPTKKTTGAQARAWPDLLADPQVTSTAYDWVKDEPVSSTEDPSGLALTTTTAYNSQGQVTKTSQPASSGTDAGTTLTTYYTGTGAAPCGGRPEWADLICQTGPAAAITGGGSNPTELPTKTMEFGLFGQTTKVTETANSVTRTTTTSYDNAGRPATLSVSGGIGTAVPSVTTAYDSITGLPLTQTSSTGGTITKTYDGLGRPMSYTDADGGSTRTSYDALDRPTSVTDSVPSTTSYTYDTAVDPRGMVTKVTDSVAGSFTAAYDSDGGMIAEGLPGGYTMKEGRDPTGAATARTYTRDSDALVLVSDSVTATAQGRWATHAGTPGVTASQNYTYDATGRLTQVQDTSTDAVCTTRGYTFDKNTNRKTLATAVGAPNADCATTGGTTTNYTYDTADRLVNTGYTYDAFGRTTALPGTSLAYFANDLVQQQTAGTSRQTWALDSNFRFRSWTTESNATGTWTQTAAKVNHYGSDSDSPRWTVENSSPGTLTRNVAGPDSSLAAVTTATGGTVLELQNLHGDIALALPVDTSQAPVVLDSDEYGNVRTNQAAVRYAWLGGAQRSDETLTGLTLMGVRLYNASTGRFLSVDPVPGGNANAYEYTGADPVNKVDLDGRWNHYKTLYASWGRVSSHVWSFWDWWGWGWHVGASVRFTFNRWGTNKIANEGPYALTLYAFLAAAVGGYAATIMYIIGAVAAWITWEAYRAKERGKCLYFYASARWINGVPYWYYYPASQSC